MSSLVWERTYFDLEREQMEEKKRSKKNLYKILFIVFLIGLGISVGVIAHDIYVKHMAKDKISDLAGNDTETESGTESGTEVLVEPTETEEDILAQLGIVVPEKNLDWNALKETNPDIYAWIYIPNTNVDYPILQHSKDDAYYLDHDVNGNKNADGSIFSERKYNTTDFTDFNTVLYGHNMKAKTMFATLHSFKDATFFEANRYVYIYTPDKVLVYDIFAAYKFSNKHILAYYSTVSDGGKQRYLDEVFDIRDMSAHFREGVEVTVDSHILTLSTCIGGDSESRYLVQAVLIE